jgi:hypothetical protein
VKKSLLIIVALLLAALPITAQNRTSFAGTRNAWAYAYGLNPNTPGLVVDLPVNPSTAGASTTFTVASASTVAGDGTVFYPLNLWTPVYIVDASGVDGPLTPSAVAGCNSQQGLDTCSVTITPTYSHGKGARLSSGSFGLQEALNLQSAKGGGIVAIDSDWGGTNAAISLAVVVPNVGIYDNRTVDSTLWQPAATATTIIGVPTTLTALTALPSATPVGAYGTGTYHICISYVDIGGQEGACSADFSEAGLATGSFIFSPPAASAGAVGYTAYISLTSGSYALAYKVPLTAAICTLTTLETTTPACAVTNATYGQTGATATVTAITLATSPTAINSAVISTSAITHGNTTARTTYQYVPGTGITGTPSNIWPAATSAAAGTTVPSAIGTVNIAPGFMNQVGRKLRVCGYGTFSGASTATVLNMSLQWDSFGMNNAGLPVTIANTAATPSSAFAASVVNTNFCFIVATSVASASATGGSIIPLSAQVSWGNTATGITPSAGGLVTTAAVGSLNLASEARLHIVYNHTTGTDGTGMVLNGYTIESF